jgi:hypothetical protein
MNEGRNPGEVLFNVGDRNILQDGLYSIIGPSNHRAIAVRYGPERNLSTWLSPSAGRLMALVLNCALLQDRFVTEKPMIYFGGGPIAFDFDYTPTPNQSTILQNWEDELEKAGIGGPKIDPFDLRVKS